MSEALRVRRDRLGGTFSLRVQARVALSTSSAAREIARTTTSLLPCATKVAGARSNSVVRQEEHCVSS